jgi:hypothetical protein
VNVTGAPVDIPELDAWEADMLNWGQQHGAWLVAHQNDANLDATLTQTYYDAARVFYQIADYTGDTAWNAYAEAAVHVYRDRYVLPNNGTVQGFWSFTRGLVMHYERTGDVASKNAALAIAHNAAYHADTSPIAWMVDSDVSREVAYAINSYLDEERLGQPRRARLDDYVELAKGHVDQWINGEDDIYAPFMFGLTADALVQYYTRVEQDPAILTKLRTLADWTWDNCWVAADQAFIYRLPDTTGAPDLNLLIAPTYEWIYQMTGVQSYRDKADAIFVGGVTGAWLGNGKQFNQNYRVSFDYVEMRGAQSIQQGLMYAAPPMHLTAANLAFAKLATSNVEESVTQNLEGGFARQLDVTLTLERDRVFADTYHSPVVSLVDELDESHFAAGTNRFGLNFEWVDFLEMDDTWLLALVEQSRMHR